MSTKVCNDSVSVQIFVFPSWKCTVADTLIGSSSQQTRGSITNLNCTVVQKGENWSLAYPGVWHIMKEAAYLNVPVSLNDQSWMLNVHSWSNLLNAECSLLGQFFVSHFSCFQNWMLLWRYYLNIFSVMKIYMDGAIEYFFCIWHPTW